MAIGWFICGYDIQAGGKGNVRECAMNRHNALIFGDGGNWSNVEVLGGVALVKVRASASTLTTVSGTTGFSRLTNHALITDSLSDLTVAQRNAITTRILAMGYTQAELDTTMGNTLALWRQKSFETLLQFIAGRRVKSRFDFDTHQFVFDGPFIPCGKTVAMLDSEVTE